MAVLKVQPHGEFGNEIHLCVYNESEKLMYFKVGRLSLFTAEGTEIAACSDESRKIHIFQPLKAESNIYLIIDIDDSISDGMILECEIIEMFNDDTCPRKRTKKIHKFHFSSLDKWKPIKEEK